MSLKVKRLIMDFDLRGIVLVRPSDEVRCRDRALSCEILLRNLHINTPFAANLPDQILDMSFCCLICSICFL